MTWTPKALAEHLNCQLAGDNTLAITGLASIESAAATDLIFVSEGRDLDRALASRAAAVIAGPFAKDVSTTKPLLICAHPRLAFARAAKVVLAGSNQVTPGIHETAIIHPSARVSPSAQIDCRATIRAGSVVGANSYIGANVCIGENVAIGDNCSVRDNVTIYANVRIGNRVIIHSGAVLGSDGFGYVRDPSSGHYEKFPQIGTLIIEDDVEIGANATIDRGALDTTRIARGTKIDNLVHIAHNVQVGEDVVIAAQTGLSGSAVLENGVIVAGQVGIADHVRVESGAILGAQCGVPSNKVIRGKGIVFWGTPARPIREYLKELAVLARLAKKSG
jgi:UDP-3-O-[3-hydroxymyristoyl] glucosamine N-acyltransferase